MVVLRGVGDGEVYDHDVQERRIGDRRAGGLEVAADFEGEAVGADRQGVPGDQARAAIGAGDLFAKRRHRFTPSRGDGNTHPLRGPSRREVKHMG